MVSIKNILTKNASGCTGKKMVKPQCKQDYKNRSKNNNTSFMEWVISTAGFA